MNCPPDPPIVSRINPANREVSDLIGAERLFRAWCDQPATLNLYLDGNLLYSTSPNVQDIIYTFPSAPPGQHIVRVVATNENGSGENYWNWNMYQYVDCHVPSGAYLNFTINYIRCGFSNCGGGSGNWSNAVCLQNAVIRYARAGQSTPYFNILSGCYWMEKIGCPEHCYVEEIYSLDIYIAKITNENYSPSFQHDVCAEYLGGDIKIFSNWRFFQYENLNIQPGDANQMPYGTEAQKTKIRIYKVTGILDCGHYDRAEDPEMTFEIDQYGNVTVPR